MRKRTKTHICFTSWGLFTSNKIKEINKADKPPKNPKPQAFPETRPIVLSVDNSFKYELQKTHPISNEIFEIITKAIAKDKSPFSGKYNKAVNSEHRIVKKTRNDFRKRRPRVIYEEHYGTIPKGYVIRHIDGNKDNDDPSNLQAISRSENMKLNSKKWKF